MSNFCSSIAVDSAALELAVAVKLSVTEKGQPISTAAFEAERPIVTVNIEVSSTGVAVTIDNGAETAAGFWSSVCPCHLGFMSIIVGAQSQVHSGVYRGGRQKGNEAEKGELHYV